MTTVPRPIHGSGSAVWLTLALAAGIANGCSTANRSPPASPGNTALATDYEEPMQPASAFPASSRRETSPQTAVIADPSDSRSEPQADTSVEATSATDLGVPACAMHAESTARGIALIFSARTNTPEQVAAQVRGIAKELELDRSQASETPSVEPSSFGTRQIAELAARPIVTQTPEGGRLTIDAKDPATVHTLRARVLWHMADFIPNSRDERNLCPIVPREAGEQRDRDIERAALELQRRNEQ